MATFVTVQYGAFIDLLDENGRLTNLHLVNPHDNVRDCFEERIIYIPVMLEKIPDSDNYKTVKPQLEDWEKTFPQLEKKIKILTGEVKRKKSPYRGLGGGRVVDRKASSLSNKSDAGRSQSQLGRPSTILQSTTNTGRKSVVGNKGEIKMASKVKGGKGKKK
ncbi:uncharacterized protein LOC132730209 isoform X2 [Ruditapes philippinarum]|uniref:uncharacterized protein LOC132730209 isoform X2 n=1 Tax=Ruditapes philippinarum TaxID=129788 RepID=UPI00295B7346|nr:uncharacterized protein LOC132730209 isoform X2 [Ruditapes philippinarum]